jgi:hypothetical protein
MPAIITNTLRTFTAQQFLESLQENTTPWIPKRYYEGDSVRNFDNTYVCVQGANSEPSVVIDDTKRGVDDRGPIETSNTVTTDNYGNVWIFTGKNLYNNLYLGIGKQTRWGDASTNGLGGGSEFSPPSPFYNNKTAFDALDNLISAKRIKASDVSLAIPRVDWEYGVIYTMYDDSKQFDHFSSATTDTNLFVVCNVGTEYRVYKCINNSVYNPQTMKYEPTPSKEMPTSNKADGFITMGDGYVWKFMYALDINDNVTDDYIECFNVYNNPILGPGGTVSSYMSSYDVYVNSSRKNYPIEWITIDQAEDGGSNTGSGFGDVYVDTTVNDYRTASIVKDVDTGSHILSFKSSGVRYIDLEANGNAPAHFVGDLVRLVNITNNNLTYYVNITSYINKTTTGDYRFTVSPVLKIDTSGNNITPSSFSVDEIVGSDLVGITLLAPRVYVTGNGKDLVAHGVISGGMITSAKILHGGEGYTSIYETFIGHTGRPTTIFPKIRAIASPQGAHGLSCVDELNACFCIIDAEFRMDEEGYFPVTGASSQFRQVTLMTNLKDKAGKFTVDYDRVIGPRNPYYSEENATQEGLALDSVTTDRINTLHAITGRAAKVLYVENRKVVSRSAEQIENIRIVLEF